MLNCYYTVCMCLKLQNKFLFSFTNKKKYFLKFSTRIQIWSKSNGYINIWYWISGSKILEIFLWASEMEGVIIIGACLLLRTCFTIQLKFPCNFFHSESFIIEQIIFKRILILSLFVRSDQQHGIKNEDTE